MLQARAEQRQGERKRESKRERDRARAAPKMAATSSKAETDAVIIVMKAVQLFVMLPLCLLRERGRGMAGGMLQGKVEELSRRRRDATADKDGETETAAAAADNNNVRAAKVVRDSIRLEEWKMRKSAVRNQLKIKESILNSLRYLFL